MTEGEGIKVAVLDEGVELTHPDLLENLLPGYDVTDGPQVGAEGSHQAGDNHGTNCAGIIAAADNSIGIKGVAWPAREMPISYFDNLMAWSYSYGSALSDITVTLTCLTQGKEQEWNFSSTSADGHFNVDNNNYGQPGCVIFRPEGISIMPGDQYLVTIKQAGNIIANYRVHFFE